MTSAAAAAAACGAPNRAGSASGLRKSPCSAAPDSPSVAPISAASSVRGRRMSRTMMPAGPSPESSPAIAARGDSPAGPTINEMIASTRIRAAKAISMRKRPTAPFLQARGTRSNGIPVRDAPSVNRTVSCADASALRRPTRRAAWSRSTSAATSLCWRSRTRRRSPGSRPMRPIRSLSAVAEKAKAYPRLDWQAESTIALQPDLVLIGQNDRPVTKHILRAQGLRLYEIALISDLDAARRQIIEVAAVLGSSGARQETARRTRCGARTPACCAEAAVSVRAAGQPRRLHGRRRRASRRRCSPKPGSSRLPARRRATAATCRSRSS